MQEYHVGILGIFAGVCTTVSFVPQIIKIIKTKNVRDISLRMYVVLTTGIFFWFIYGIFIEEMPIIAANIVGFVLCLSIIIMKLKYRRNG